MEKIKDAVRNLLAAKEYSHVMVGSLNLILEDKMNSIELEKILYANNSNIEKIRLEAIRMILDYSGVILEDDILTDDEMRIITLLKMFYKIKDGDFYEYGYQHQVEEILTSQLEKMYVDGLIDQQEALTKTNLQSLFGLSYDQFLKIVNKFAKAAVDRGANIKDLDTFM